MSDKKWTPAKEFDVIEIIPSLYTPSLPIGNKYVVIGSLDGYDAEIINEHGEYDTVCGEDYKVIDNAKTMREEFWQKVRDRQNKNI